MEIKLLSRIENFQSSLNELLVSCVNDGASIGFLPPLSAQKAKEYWADVDRYLADDKRILLVALGDDAILGAVQLSLSEKENAPHRAEVEKLMVKKSARGMGIATLLMGRLEHEAVIRKRTLLVLDTREGDSASFLYKRLGYCEGGKIPDFAISASGDKSSTVFFYKMLRSI